MNVFPRVAAGVTLALSLSSAAFAQRYEQVNLDANVSGAAKFVDSQLINGWGLARATGGVWWVSDEATGFATLYNGVGAKQGLVVKIPKNDPNDSTFPNGTPTGVIPNSNTTDFPAAPGKTAAFIFATLDGSIAAWNPNVGNTPNVPGAIDECSHRCAYEGWFGFHRTYFGFYRRQPLSVCCQLPEGSCRCL